ncbi:hypothetical protein [Microcoleus sp.]|uniref:hypothetical protein n=1 Tax=Microcoleus sp. TaxID=44472 RepID=UPI0035242656
MYPILLHRVIFVRSPSLNSSHRFPKQIGLQVSEDVPVKTGIMDGRSPSSPLAIELNNRYYPKNQHAKPIALRRSTFPARSGKLERSIGLYLSVIDSMPNFCIRLKRWTRHTKN